MIARTRVLESATTNLARLVPARCAGQKVTGTMNSIMSDAVRDSRLWNLKALR